MHVLMATQLTHWPGTGTSRVRIRWVDPQGVRYACRVATAMGAPVRARSWSSLRRSVEPQWSPVVRRAVQRRARPRWSVRRAARQPAVDHRVLAVMQADAGVLVDQLTHPVEVGLAEAEFVVEGVTAGGEVGCGHVRYQICGCSQQFWRVRSDSASPPPLYGGGAIQHSAIRPQERACFTT